MRDRIDRFTNMFHKPRGLRPHAWFITQVLRRFVLRPLAQLKMFTTTVENQSVVPKRDGVLIAGNHPSNWDSVVIATALDRNVVFFAKAELRDKPFVGRLMRIMGQIFVDRGNRESGAMAQSLGLRVLTHTSRRGYESGGVAAIFPEGGCTPPDGTLKKFKKGVWYLAKESGKPVIPVGLNGTDRIGIRFTNIFRPSRRQHVTLRFGEPLFAANYNGEHAAEEFLADLRARIEALRAS